MSIPAPFDYHPVKTVDEAISLLQEYSDDAKILAGGHSLIPSMKLRLSQPGHLIDIRGIDSLSYIREDGDSIAIGAVTPYIQILRSDLLQRHFIALAEAAEDLGDQQVRNRGTLGGSLAHSDPAADMPAVILALKGEIVVQGPKGRRSIQADDFFVDTFETALEPDEVLIEIRLKIPPAHTGTAYMKLENKASHYALTGSAAMITLDADGTCTAASIAITGASTKTTRASTVESALVGKKLDEATVAAASQHASDGLELVEDIHGSKAYRAQMTVVMTRRAVLHAAEHAS